MTEMQWFRFWNQTLESKKAQALDGTTFKRWVNLMCLANRGTPRGTLPTDVEEIRFALRLSRLSVTLLIADLVKRALVDEIPGGGWRMHNWERWQPQSDDAAERMRQVRGAAAKAYVGRALDDLQGHSVPVEAEPVRNKGVTRSAPDTDRDSEADTKKNPPHSISPPKIGGEKVSPDDLMALWNELIDSPKVQGLSGKRLTATKRRVAEHDDLSWWRAVITTLARTPFLRGGGPRRWKASFDWLMANDTNALRVLEGAYGEMTPAERKAQMEAILDDTRRHSQDSHLVRGRLPGDVHSG